MKNLFKLFLALPLLFITACSNDDDGTTTPIEVSTTYQLKAVGDSNVSGIAKFIKNDDNSVTIELQLNGTTAGNMHPAHIHYNTALEGGAVALTLGTVDGATGTSTITVTTLDDSTPITYEELIDFDGYINVHLSESELGTVVAQGDIGQNVLTGRTFVYNLTEIDGSGVSGTIVFAERANESIIATIALTGTLAGDLHPAHIHAGSVEEAPGDILLTFNPVQGATGLSITNNITALDDSTPFLFNDVQMFDGYVNVHLSSEDTTVIAQGNIGANTLQ